MSVFYWFMSRFYNESRARLGMSCHLNGTGFMVSDEAIREIGWDTHSLTEDLEFTALSALAGYRVGWMPDARIYDEQTSRFWDSCVQRRRWTVMSYFCDSTSITSKPTLWRVCWYFLPGLPRPTITYIRKPPGR